MYYKEDLEQAYQLCNAARILFNNPTNKNVSEAETKLNNARDIMRRVSERHRKIELAIKLFERKEMFPKRGEVFAYTWKGKDPFRNKNRDDHEIVIIDIKDKWVKYQHLDTPTYTNTYSFEDLLIFYKYTGKRIHSYLYDNLFSIPIGYSRWKKWGVFVHWVRQLGVLFNNKKLYDIGVEYIKL